MATDGARPDAEAHATGRTSSEITRRMVQLYRERFGRGPTKARTTLNTNTVMVMFEDTLTTAEATLYAAGQDVATARRAVNDSIKADAEAIVREAVGRPVRGFVTGLDADADLSVLVFFLEPVEENGRVGVSEAGASGEPAELASRPGTDEAG